MPQQRTTGAASMVRCGTEAGVTSRASQGSVSSSLGRRSSDSFTVDSFAGSGAGDGSGSAGTSTTQSSGAKTLLAVADPLRSPRVGTARVVAEGRLKDIHVRIERSDEGEVIIIVEARCHGRTIRSRESGWRARYTEVARALMREMVSALRVALEAAIDDVTTCRVDEAARWSARLLGDRSDRSDRGDPTDRNDRGDLPSMFSSACLDPDAEGVGEWDACDRALLDAGRERGERVDHGERPMDVATSQDGDNGDNGYEHQDHQQRCDEEVKSEPDADGMTDGCTDSVALGHVPGVKIAHIEWASPIRWGGDNLYDPAVDGDILLEAACNFEDPTHVAAPSNRGRQWHDLDESDLVGAVLTHMGSSACVACTAWSLHRTLEPTERTLTPWNPPDEGEEVQDDPITLSRLAYFKTRTAQVRLMGDAD